MKQNAKKILLFVLFFALNLFSANFSYAQTEGQEATKKERKQSLNFEDELVEGSTQKPELFYLFQKKNFNYKKLIKLRENFLPEMRQTSDDIQRFRGGH